MAILHVRNVPDDLYEQIRKRARSEKRSLGAEVLTLLQRGLDDSRQGSGPGEQSLAAILEEMRRGRESRAWDGVDSVQLIREDRGPLE